MNRLLLLLVVLLAPAAGAQERSLVIQKFDATISVNRDASIEVTESITARFTGSWNGIFRTIPVDYRTPQGFNWTIRFDLISATDDAGAPLRTEASRERHYIKYKIWVPGAENTTRTVVLRYRATNALRFFEDHDELYWNVTGDEWDVAIESAAARVVLPEGAQGVRAIAFNGAYGSTARDAEVATQGGTVTVTMTKQLDFHEGLTVVIGWNKGLVTEPTKTEKALGFVAVNWPLVIPLPVFFAMYAIWRRRGRDPDRLPISVQYDPPDGLTPGEAGTLLDNKVDMRDITATLVDLAVRGFLKIEEREESKLFGLTKGREFVFHRLKPESEWAGLKEHERVLLGGIFAGRGAVVELSELENEFYKNIPKIKDALFHALIDHKYYRARPDSVQGAWVFGAVALGALIGVGGSALGQKIGLTPVPFVIAAFLSTVIVVAFGIFMPARTVPGARALERVLGFEEFLQRVEGDRLRDFVKTPAMFERFLPFAMAFGVEKKWAQAFKDIATESPSWYVGSHPGMFNAAVFSSHLSTMTSRAESTMSSAPRSSSGSGFSGGSSGGGGGGGGGEGFRDGG